MVTAYYAVFDTNVLVSALLSDKSDTATVLVVQKIFDGDIIPIYSPQVYEEYVEVLNRAKFAIKKWKINRILHAIQHFGLLIEPQPTSVILPDLRDAPFYEVALEKQDERSFLVTGNIKHFPREPFIVTPRELIDIINSENSI